MALGRFLHNTVQLMERFRHYPMVLNCKKWGSVPQIWEVFITWQASTTIIRPNQDSETMEDCYYVIIILEEHTLFEHINTYPFSKTVSLSFPVVSDNT